MSLDLVPVPPDLVGARCLPEMKPGIIRSFLRCQPQHGMLGNAPGSPASPEDECLFHTCRLKSFKRPPYQLKLALIRTIAMTGKTCSVFVVEDDQSVLDSLTLLLESAGYQSRGFGSAEELLESGSLQSACCLILDIKLPGMSGFQLQELLVASHTPIPVIFITGHDLPGMERQALRLGAIAYLRKPFEDRTLLAAIQPCLKAGAG